MASQGAQMPRNPRKGGGPRGSAAAPGMVAVLSRNPALIAAVQEVLSRGGLPAPLVLRDNAALLAAVLTGRSGLGCLVLTQEAPAFDPALLDALAEASPTARFLAMTLPIGEAADIRRSVAALLTGPAAPPPLRRVQPGAPPETLHGGGLLLRYQPVVGIRDRRLVMLEALARWRSDPVALSPGIFVPVLEEAGLARALAGAVIRLAARDLMATRLARHVTVSVNLPVQELERPDLPGWISSQLQAARMPRERLALELTETAPVHDHARLERSLRRLRAAGHEVLIDDFEMDDGRRRLLRLPFSGVKLDKDFVQRLPHSARARQQVRRLTRGGLKLTAEGVSTPAIWRQLRDLGVARAQGFWLARPLPISALPAWSRRWRATQP